MMEENNTIEVRDVKKTFRVNRRSDTLKDALTYFDNKKERRTVLENISFDVKRGETVGIIGRNGSGKSTMLKLLTKILSPNEGTIETKGKIACLIELGAGFHPDMTGMENIYINASIFGLSKELIDQRYNDIVEFSGIEEFIHERVRNYSSGMYMRLAFSVAINVDADILLIDEILSVGDMQFQKKCMDRLDEFRKKNGSIVLVTHNIGQAEKFCDRIIWLEEGYIKLIGDPKTVCDAYRKFMIGKDDDTSE